MESLLEHRNRFDYIIVETDGTCSPPASQLTAPTGLSDPTFTRAFFQEVTNAASLTPPC